ncbi:hypothetical protein LF1_08600 [Rubripirellula obstinata]|uniref:Uncharacterized protein n=1 Tax=Rubripirellula obstinata TaxID=406547 RepID=A0A5B1CFS1_9BACT|nr:hypothetical protein [Rubripirellula obstinata]KAA1258343.1 hypothetical protein LF1_08600 [Rubripirellula obstinata]
MAKKATKKSAKPGKAAIIRGYLAKNPSHTWKDAEETLKKHGITSAYFAMTKSNTKKKTAPKKKKATAATGSKNTTTIDAVAFARASGGIDKAIKALEELREMQV